VNKYIVKFCAIGWSFISAAWIFIGFKETSVGLIAFGLICGGVALLYAKLYEDRYRGGS
jgi:hypothetical protein